MKRILLPQLKKPETQLNNPKGVTVEKIGDIHNADLNTLHINDTIDETFGIGSIDVQNALNDLDDTKPLTVIINSPGGSVWEAITIHNMLAQWPSELTTHISGVAASAASFLALVGDVRTISDNGTYMIHNPWAVVGGNAVELRSFADLLDKTADGLVEMYERRSNLTGSEIRDALRGPEGTDGTYFTASEALAAGFVTGIVDTQRKPKEGQQASTGCPSRKISAWKRFLEI